jgi:hypothetical protein
MPELSHIDPRSAALLPQLPNFLKSRHRIPRLQAQNSRHPILRMTLPTGAIRPSATAAAF